jgi:hypothetical protein
MPRSIHYAGFQVQPHGRDYSYYVLDPRALQDRWRNDQTRDGSERTIFANKGQACLRSSLDISCRRGSDGPPHDRPCDPAQGKQRLEEPCLGVE